MTASPTGTFQDPPRLHDEWVDDLALRRLLERLLPPEVHAEVAPGLAAMGRLAATDLRRWADQADDRDAEPRLVPYDAWGRRIDRVEVAPAWDRIAEVAVRHGVVATAHERAHGEWSRVHQFALAYLFGPSSALYSCPLAMTDGAVVTLAEHGDRRLVDEVVPRLVSRDPAEAWTSGQWMTERAGGSDVGRSETLARRGDDGRWRLTGTKWFTSAVTAQMALALARPEGNPTGGRGLALFHVPTRLPADGQPFDDAPLNGIRILRLKDKLGTRQLPTAELELDGTLADPVGPLRDGTLTIGPMLTITRVWNAVSAAGYLRRGLALARDYAGRREAFGRLLADQPLHQATLAWLRVRHEATLQLTFRVVELLGRQEAGVASDRERRALELLVPITKLVTGKDAVAGASEALEAFGGAGYVEDTHLPQLLRDSQVLPIWEGTTNVLALDALRRARDDHALDALVGEVADTAGSARDARLVEVARQAVDAAEHATAWLSRDGAADDQLAAHGARRFTMTVGRALQAALLVRQAQHDLDTHDDARTVAVARHLAAEGLDLLTGAWPTPRADAALARDEPLEPAVLDQV